MTKDKWEIKNSLDLNQEYAEKILSKFNIDKYHFILNDGYLCLIIEKNLKKYKIFADYKTNRMNIYRCEVHSFFGKYTKENMKLKKYFDTNCIWNSIKWVYNDSKL